MTENLRAITLRMVKYSDSAAIATLWTDRYGRMSASVPLGGSKEARRRRAIMMPLGVFEAVARSKPGQEVARLSDVRPIVPSPAASGDPTRGVVTMFLSDFLYAVLKENVADRQLAQYIFDSAQALGSASPQAVANFHLYFIYHLGHFLGIAPDMGTYAPGSCFDMREGRFSPTAPLHRLYLDPERAQGVRLLARMQPRTLGRIKLSRASRNEMLDRMLDYYTLHLANVSNLPTLSVVREIFR